MWSLAYDRTPTHGYEPTREAPCGHSPGVWEFVRQVFRILSRIGIAPMRLAPLVALTSAVICGLLFGCSPAAMGPTTFLADPGKYDYYSCEQLAEQRKIAADRELELKLLMDKAEQGRRRGRKRSTRPRAGKNVAERGKRSGPLARTIPRCHETDQLNALRLQWCASSPCGTRHTRSECRQDAP
jgi:hypothetical protein